MNYRVLTFLNCIMALFYFLFINYTDHKGISAFAVLASFYFGLIAQLVSAGINKPAKSKMAYSLINIVRFVCFLLIPMLSEKNIIAGILAVLTILVLDSYQVFWGGDTIPANAKEALTENQIVYLDLFYKSLFVHSFEICLLIRNNSDYIMPIIYVLLAVLVIRKIKYAKAKRWHTVLIIVVVIIKTTFIALSLDDTWFFVTAVVFLIISSIKIMSFKKQLFEEFR